MDSKIIMKNTVSEMNEEFRYCKQFGLVNDKVIIDTEVTPILKSKRKETWRENGKVIEETTYNYILLGEVYSEEEQI